ncbi:MAG: hypothetical protein NC337_09760 [Roseburia sp.]|nr:hypothetical protein [Roseburia sp.]
MKKKLKYLVGLLLGVMLMGMPVLAAEYTVTEVNGVLYTNDQTVILADADDGTVVLPEVAADLPIQVTGVTSNGYFRINLNGETFYIQGIGLSPATTEQAAVNDIAAREKEVYNILIAQKAFWPEGMSWTNDNYVDWKGGTYSGGYGCAGFAFALSDAAFGDVRARIHTDYTNIRVGDILRINGNTHSVIVLEVKADSVIVAEGNYNSSVHWGREIAKSKLPGEGNYIMTRY